MGSRAESIHYWLCLSLVVAHVDTQAQIFLCKDASGRTISSDRPIPECVGRALREYDRRGVHIRDVPAPLTAEQKRQLKLEEDRRRAEEAAADEQRQIDRALRMRYRSEDDIERARRLALEAVGEQMRREAANLAAAESQSKEARAEADALARRNAAIPAGLQQKMDESDQAIRESKRTMQERETEVAAINARFDGIVKRYRELAGVTASRSQ